MRNHRPFTAARMSNHIPQVEKQKEKDRVGKFVVNTTRNCENGFLEETRFLVINVNLCYSTLEKLAIVCTK